MNAKAKICIVDDEPDIREILRFNLEAAGYAVTCCGRAEEVLAMSDVSDLYLLDVMMPGMSGFDLATMLKQQSETRAVPIIFLTAKSAEDDTLAGFRLGADDYVAKPFSVREVLARVKAVLARTAHTEVPAQQLTFEGLQLDPSAKTLMMDGTPVEMTKTEFELFSLLLSQPGCVFSRQQLLDLVWPEDVVVTERTVDVNITRIRKKIGRYATHIVTRQGYGYLFQKED